MKAASACRPLHRWPGKVPAGKVENGIFASLDWFPTFVAAAGDANIADELKKGKDLGGTTYKIHLDGYNQLDLITGKGPSNRHEVCYFAESTLGAVRVDDFKYRFIDQPGDRACGLQGPPARSFGDLQRLQRTTATTGARCGLIVRHSDAERERASSSCLARRGITSRRSWVTMRRYGVRCNVAR